MTGFTELKDLDNDDVEHYKRINVEPSLRDEDYKVFGSIVSENNSKLEEICVNFELYDLNGFYAIIKKLKETNINITECYVSWIIVGNPSKLSVFSPKNRDFQVKYFKRSIILQPNQLDYYIEAPYSLSQGYMIFVHAYYSQTIYEPSNIIKLIKWSYNIIKFQIINCDYNEDDESNSIDLHICILYSDHKSLKIGNGKMECPSGCILTEENLDKNLIIPG